MRTPRTVMVPAAGVLALAMLPGCVERKLIVRSDPPGAILFLEDEQIPGQTPVEVPFEWDGVRRVRLQTAGHRVLESTATIEPRWYDWFPLDVFAHFLYPGTIQDVREFDYELEAYSDTKATPEQLAEQRERLDALKERAEVYRAGGSEGPGNAAVATAPAAQPTSPGDGPPPPLPPRSATDTPGQPAKPEPAPVPTVPRPKPPEPLPPEADEEPQKPAKPGDPLPLPKKPGR